MRKRMTTWAVVGVAVLAAGWYLVNPYGTATWDLRARTLGFVPFVMHSRTMHPTVRRGEVVDIETSAYAFDDPQRGDVVVFWYPKDPTVAFMFRVIGVGGDRVRLDRDGVWLNDRLLDEAYVLTEQGQHSFQPMNEITVPEDALFVMGDNRMVANDSRYWGTVPRDAVIGRHSIASRPLAFREPVIPDPPESTMDAVAISP